MPTIDVEMARSLRGGMWQMMKDNFARSLTESLNRRDIISDTSNSVNNVKHTFSSWDNCMQANYCKWPVIAIIVVGSLILLSIVACVVRCCCCGMSCCCSCFRCLRCCECCSCCDPPQKNSKYLDAPYVPPHHGYQPQAPMHSAYAPPPPQHYQAPVPPQYAEFETGRKGGGDALPQMPGWDTANSKKVMIEDEEGVEMNALKPKTNDPRDPRAGPSATGTVSPLSVHDQRSGYNRTPHSQSQYSNGMPNQRTVSPFSPNDRQGGFTPGPQDYNRNNNLVPPSASNGSNRLSDGYGLDQPYDHAVPTVPFIAGTYPNQASTPGPHGYGQAATGTQGYAEMPTEPGARNQTPHSGYAEMSSGALAVGALGAGASQELHGNNTAQSFEMAAAPAGFGQKAAEPAQHIMEMPTGDHIAPVELDGGMAPVAATLGSGNRSPQGQPGEPSLHSPTGGYPDGYGMRHQATGESAVGPYGNRPPVGRPGEMLRRGTGDSASTGGAPYGSDPRMRNSPGPRSPGGGMPPSAMIPGPRNSPGPRRGPGPGPGPGPYQQSPVNPPGPYGGSGYGQSPRDGPGRTYSPAPQMRSPIHHVPLAQPQPRAPDVSPPPTSPINNSGFDFNSGYSRPQNSRQDSQPSMNNGRPGYGQQGWNR